MSNEKQAEWERIEDYEMDSCVPGYPKLAPHQQWRVTSGHQQWMIYQWWSGTGFDDDEYLYSMELRAKMEEPKG